MVMDSDVFQVASPGTCSSSNSLQPEIKVAFNRYYQIIYPLNIYGLKVAGNQGAHFTCIANQLGPNSSPGTRSCLWT